MQLWDHRALSQLNFRILPILFALMAISLLVIAGVSGEGEEWLTPLAKAQLRWFFIGWVVYLFFAGMDYRYLRKWTWPLYALMLLMLLGLYFTESIQNVHRWYRIPFLGLTLQPSEYAKLITVIVLSSFLDHKSREIERGRLALRALLIAFIPFLLILKQPDLGTALVLYPITLVIFYLGGVKKRMVAWLTGIGALAIAFVSLTFIGVLSHEEMRPYVTRVIKEYQYERLNPHTYHQRAAQAAIALGGVTGSGWHGNEFTARHWLPAASTDSVFAAYGEEFGLLGIALLLLFFCALFYFSFQVVAVAKDRFGRLLAAGITVYLAVHVIVNAGMMCGFLPITGVPLILVTYGGSSVISTMMALGILQSIYSRRYMF